MKRWRSCSHVKPTPPWSWTPSLAVAGGGGAGRGLGHVHRSVAVGIVGVERHRRVLRGASRALDRERHVGELVLDRLERADRDVELVTLLHVRERHVEEPARGPDHLRGERDGGPFDDRIEAGLIDPVHVTALGLDFEESARELSMVEINRTSASLVATRRICGPGSTTAIHSTRSASGTNVFTGSALTTHSPFVPASVRPCRRRRVARVERTVRSSRRTDPEPRRTRAPRRRR